MSQTSPPQSPHSGRSSAHRSRSPDRRSRADDLAIDPTIYGELDTLPGAFAPSEFGDDFVPAAPGTPPTRSWGDVWLLRKERQTMVRNELDVERLARERERAAVER